MGPTVRMEITQPVEEQSNAAQIIQLALGVSWSVRSCAKHLDRTACIKGKAPLANRKLGCQVEASSVGKGRRRAPCPPMFEAQLRHGLLIWGFIPHFSCGILGRLCSTIGGDTLVAKRSSGLHECIAGVLCV